MSEDEARVRRRLLRQAASCKELGSPLYAHLLEQAAADLDTEGPVATVLAGHGGDPPGSALALRFMGAVHRLVLEGRAQALAEYYPSAGGKLQDDAWPAFRATLEGHAEELKSLVDRPVQTNEVGRSAALVGGFLVVAQRTGMPLRVLEVGASGGLNLRWDHYLYEARGETWGDPESPVRLCSFNSELLPPFDERATVTDRRGCDPRPLDPADPADQLTLLSYVWPDQAHRIRLLRNALDIAARVPAVVDEASAPDWTADQLAAIKLGVATVVYHSIVLQYLTEPDRNRLIEVIEAAGESASTEAPLAWLRMEPAGPQAEVRLTIWPGFEERVIATAHFHGASIRWLG